MKRKVMAKAGRGLSNWAALSQGQAEWEALGTVPGVRALSSENQEKADWNVAIPGRERRCFS